MKNLISYIIAIALSILYMYFLDEESGLIITAILLTAPIVSLLITVLCLKTTNIDIKPSSDIINCGDSLEAQINIKRRFSFISPVISIDIDLSANFEEYPKVGIRFAPNFRRNSSKTITLNSKYSTSGNLRIAKIVFSDFLGIFNLKAKSDISDFDVAIIPKINHSENENALFDAFSSNLNYDDEQESTGNPFSVHTTAGYEHREYIESDSPKRINWKLSSKLGKLMIRLDDAVCASKPIFVIDLSAKDEIDRIANTNFEEQKSILLNGLYKRADKLLSNCLGTLSYFANHGIECTVYCEGLNEPVICGNDIDILNLANAIANQSITQAASKTQINDALSAIENESNIVYFSFSQYPPVSKLLSTCKKTNANAAIVLASGDFTADFAGIPAYYYDSNNSLTAR